MLIIASDHAGLKLKQKLVAWLKNQGLDYVDYAKKAIDYFSKNCDANTDKLILVCGSGVGMSIVANRQQNIRAVLAYSSKQAKQGRNHNNCNCLCLGGRNTGYLKAKHIVNVFLKTNFLGGKYADRLNTI